MVSGIRLTQYLCKLCAIVLAIHVVACSTTQPKLGDVPAKRQLADVMADDDKSTITAVYDPWERYNHWMYDFNARFDRYIFLPAAKVYKAVLPGFARAGIHNFFSNLSDIGNLANAILQGKPAQSVRTLGRLAANSTVGIGGLWDPASTFGLEYQREDFGQTLGRWGLGPGPFLVLPILGPSTLRDAPSLYVDLFFHPMYKPEDWLIEVKDGERLALGLVNSIDARANIGFEYYGMGSPFEYYWVRSLWLEYRKLEINK